MVSVKSKVRCPAVLKAAGAHGRETIHACTKDAGHKGKHDGGFGSWKWSDPKEVQ